MPAFMSHAFNYLSQYSALTYILPFFLFQMMIHYNLPNYADVHEFLSLLAKRFGRLKKGGLPDSDKAAKSVLQDWNK